jgi:carbonic anhydrase
MSQRESGYQRKLLDQYETPPWVNAVQGAPGNLLANAIRRNVTLNVEKLKGSTPILKSIAADKKIRVVGGIYELNTGRVQLLT